MLELTSERLLNAWDKAAKERPWLVRVGRRDGTLQWKVTPRTSKRSGTRTFEERLERQFYFVTIEIRQGRLFGECRDRTGNLCPANYFGRVCFHVGSAVIRLTKQGERKAA